MAAWRTLGVLTGLLVFQSVGFAQSYTLTEIPKTGECFRYTLDTTVTGMLKIPTDGKQIPIKLAVTGKHAFTQRTLMVKDDAITRTARSYEKAETTVAVGTDNSKQALRSDRQLIIAQQGDAGIVCYSIAGPLTREEKDLVSDHLDTLRLTSILPTKAVDLDEKWTLSNPTAQMLCSFEGLISHDLQARVSEVKDGAAIVRIEGKASGIELGAMVNVEIDATLSYALLPKRITSLEWKRRDVRDSGPANPPSELETTVKLTRTVLENEPKDLSDSSLVSVPTNMDIPGPLAQLSLKDPKGRYSMMHARDWHVVSASDSHLVMRLIDRGDLIAQGTITTWRKAEPGKHLSGEEFKQIVNSQPGWELEEQVDDGEIPTDDGRWLYRITGKGMVNGLKVVQTFYCLADKDGNQLLITFTMKPTHSTKIGTRDVALVNAIEFVK